ncbi:hypothetical protein EMPS_07335 [Entomortierella parvispora]|uniref:F-box domain-containing protein n=1 Tax=Entomortierella parvispora TaxID=205924 RepID=A0A9P3LYB9_9FUNG|nr:hypothetical protein EMPS_07335 [Entomortierella parvispora]
MVANYLGTNTLAKAVRVSRQWHRHLLPELWSWIHLYSYGTRFGLASPHFFRSFARYGHFLHVLCIIDVKNLDMFRSRPIHLLGHDYCLVKNLTHLCLEDDLVDSRDIGGEKELPEQEIHRLFGLILIARADYEKMNDLLDQLATESSSENDSTPIQTTEKKENQRILVNIGGDYLTPELLPSVDDDENFDEYWNRPVDALIHPNYFDPLMHLLRHNRHLRSLTVYLFPSWSEQAIRAICREGLPLLQELDLGSKRSAMVSTRLMRILLNGLTPKLRKLNIWISFLHDDENPEIWTAKALENFWHYRYRKSCRDPMMTCLPIEPPNEHDLDLELADRYDLKELSINQPDSNGRKSRIEQEGALRSLVPFLRRCHQLERLELVKIPRNGSVMKELTATLYDFCPLFNAFEVINSPHGSRETIKDECFEQVLLASREGWRSIDLSSARHLSWFSIYAFMGTVK